jgi:alkaline phosphatase D
VGGLDRRQFLARLIAAAAAGTLAACGDDGDDGGRSGSDTTRPGGGTATTSGTAEVELASDPFTLGVASGDPLPTSVILWTRLAIDPLALDGAGGMSGDVPVRWEVATDEAFEDVVASGEETATAALGHSVHVDVQDLDPDARYHYRFHAGGHTSAPGRTRTAPDDDADVAELRLAMASCQDIQVGYYAAHRSIAESELDLVLFLGDYIYEYAGRPDALRPAPGDRCTTLADYRIRYAFYNGDRDLQAARASCPWVVTWDDHEVENNYADLLSQLGTPEDDFAAQRFAAYQAYYENQPIRLDPPTSEDWPIHRSFRWGNLADLFVLDGRQYRDDQPCNTSSDALADRNECDIEGAGADMLGAEQEAWLTEGLSASTATWKVLAQQTVMSSLVLGDVVLNVDQWDGYPQARRRLLDFVAAEEISDVVVLTGDIHTAGSGVLSTDGVNGAPTPVAVEFVCSSISSNGLAEAVGLDPNTLDPAIFGLTYAELLHRGYCRCTVTPERWSTEFLIVEDVTDVASDVTVDATVTCEAGSPSLTVA